MNNTISDVWDNPNRIYPSIVYIETTNHCNATCLSCLNHRCKRTRGVMSLKDFKIIADKIKVRGLKIGAMFCFGEPLMDDNIFEKFEYGKKIGVFNPHIGFNTNVSLMTEEMFPKIIQHVPNIILSFFNTGKEYERLTGLKWETSYEIAKKLIRYRDIYAPQYPIFISVNKVKGHNLQNVKNAFNGYNVIYVQDAELRWGGTVITGVVDRMIMYNTWRCDGLKGALQVKWNGDCEFCAYDIIGSKKGGETKFANILTDNWQEINDKFKATFKAGTTLCKRCDYWHLCKRVIANNYQYVEDFEWQKPYLKEGEKFIR